MKNDPFKPRKRILKRYERDLGSLVKRLRSVASTAKDIEDLISLFETVAKTDVFKQWSERVAFNMVRSTLVENADDWRDAAKKGTRSRRIYELLNKRFITHKAYNAIIEANAEMIQTIPTTTAAMISKRASKAAIKGQRPDQILKELQKEAPTLAKYKARRIARTEVAKAQASIVEIQAVEAGVYWYEWNTANDQRVRSSHKHMDGILCRFDNPPSPEQLIGKNPQGYYNPGNIWNCRCFATPIVSLDFISWPAKVYINGAIRTVTRKEFERL